MYTGCLSPIADELADENILGNPPKGEQGTAISHLWGVNGSLRAMDILSHIYDFKSGSRLYTVSTEEEANALIPKLRELDIVLITASQRFTILQYVEGRLEVEASVSVGGGGSSIDGFTSSVGKDNVSLSINSGGKDYTASFNAVNPSNLGFSAEDSKIYLKDGGLVDISFDQVKPTKLSYDQGTLTLGLSDNSALETSLPSGSLPPLVILPCLSAKPPAGWLFLNGASFDMSAYPNLAKEFPSGKLPNLSNYVLRGAGDLIKLGEFQQDAFQNITGKIPGIIIGDGSSGCITLDSYANSYLDPSVIKGGWNSITGAFYNFALDTSKGPGLRTADETRVKSFGVNWIIEAL